MLRRVKSLLVVGLALAACSDSAATVEFAEVCKPEYDGKLVRTTGYLHAPFAALCRLSQRGEDAIKTCSYDLRDSPNGEKRLSLNIEAGQGRNRVDLARFEAKQGPATVVAQDRAALAEKTRVEVTGLLRVVPNSLRSGETLCWLEVERIERR
jgi:hypothetical protein